MKYRLGKLKVIIAFILLMTMSLINLQGNLVFANGNNSQAKSNESQTDADYLGKVTFYNYYSDYQLIPGYNTGIATDREPYFDNQHYSFESFNRKISDYAIREDMPYPLYFGDFWKAAGDNSNGTVTKPNEGQPLSGTATNFYWALNRANRYNNDYTASVQGIVSEQLNEKGNITQDKGVVLDLSNMNTKEFNYNFNSINVYKDGSTRDGYAEIVSEKNGHYNVLKINLNSKTPNVTKSFRIQLPINSENFSEYNRYLMFDIYSELEDEGSPFIALKDKDNRQIAGWANEFSTEYFDNELPKGKWKTIVVDLYELKKNTNDANGVWQPQGFDFHNVVTLWLGHWSKGSIYIDNIRFSKDLSTTSTETVELPYFNETFVSENGEVVKGLEFPFKIREKNNCNYYVFSSGKSGYKEDNSTVTDVVRINDDRTHLDYWFDVSDDDSNIVKDMNGVDGWGGGVNEPGYFPFNNPEDGGQIDKLNYGFGTKLEIQFTLTQDGQIETINKDGKSDIQFNFKGDDDVWVYIDGNLVLDMGGAHSQTEGNINFRTKTARVGKVIKGSFRSHDLYQETGESIKNFTLSSDSYINGDPNQGYNPSKVHTLTMFYMERGLIESNLYVDFNFIPVEDELTVEKEVDSTGVNEVLKEQTESIAKSIDFTFKAKQDGVYKNGVEYELNTKDILNMVEETFPLKHGDSAKFYSKFKKDSTVQIEEVADSRFTPSWITKDITVNLENENDKERNIVTGEGNITEGFEISTNVNAYDKMSHHVKFINKINTGVLEISKELDGIVDENKEFTFELTFTHILDQEISPIKYNGVYKVGEEERNLEFEEDVIKLKAGETATITGIPVGTTYKIEEILDDGYKIENIMVDNSNSIEDYIVTGIITAEPSSNKVTYVNKKIVKTVELIKVDSINSNIKLKGAKFRLNKLKENGDIDESFPSREVISDDDGHASFVDLPYGKYIITEIEAPEGYKLLRDPIKFTIDDETKDDVITIQVENIKDIELPATGGNGNITSKYIGFMLIGLAVILYSFVIIRNKKYKFN